MDFDEKEKEISGRVKLALKEVGLKQSDLAKSLEKTDATISDYLTGRIRMPLLVIFHVSDLTKKSVNWLLTGEEPMKLPGGVSKSLATTEGEVNPDHGPTVLDPDEKYLVDAFRRLSSADRYQMLRFAMEIDTNPPKENGS